VAIQNLQPLEGGTIVQNRGFHAVGVLKNVTGDGFALRGLAKGKAFNCHRAYLPNTYY
jgi:hypothetical protein